MKKLYWVKRYVRMGVERYVYAENGFKAEAIMDNAGIEANEYIDDTFVSHEVFKDDLKFISDSDILNPEDAQEEYE